MTPITRDTSNIYASKVDPPIINGDQMLLHRNESSQQKTFNFKNQDTFAKENYNLSRERATVYTQLCSDLTIIQPEREETPMVT